MKEVLNINLGQCGIQVAGLFWENFTNDLKLPEEKRRVTLEDAESFYSEHEDDGHSETEVDGGLNNITNGLRARCILVDTEVGTISEILQRKQLNRIHSSNIVCGTEATGGNWSTAYYGYGSQYHNVLEDLIAKNVENSDGSFQYFNLTFAIAGGTGSGLGNYILDMLNDEYPKLHRICNVITQDSVAAVSPYNTILCLHHLNEMSSIVNLFSNEALLQQTIQSTPQIIRETSKAESGNNSGFNNVNTLISHHLKEFGLATISKRWPGFNMNSVVNTLTPIPSLNLVCPAMVPKQFTTREATTETLLNELMRPTNRICPIPLKSKSSPIAMAIHGDFDSSSFKHLKRLKLRHNMVGWMRDGIKVSLPGAFSGYYGGGDENGMYSLINDSSISLFLGNSISNFDRLYSKKAFLHHFTKILDTDGFKNAREHVNYLHSAYDEISTSLIPPHHLLNEEWLNSTGAKINRVKNNACTDIWNNIPRTIDSDKSNWWELNGIPII